MIRVESLHEQLLAHIEGMASTMPPLGPCAAALFKVLRVHRLEVAPGAGTYVPEGQRHCAACGWLEQCGPCSTLVAIADGLQIEWEGREKW